jgi:lysozyme
MTLREQLERDEGKRNRGYKCPAGYWTIGVGYNVESGPALPDRIIDQITDFLIDHFETEVLNSLPWVSELNEARFNALVNMAFQLGIKGLLGFRHTLSLIREGDWQGAHDAMLESKWAKQTPARAKRIAKQILTGVMQ